MKGRLLLLTMLMVAVSCQLSFAVSSDGYKTKWRDSKTNEKIYSIETNIYRNQTEARKVLTYINQHRAENGIDKAYFSEKAEKRAMERVAEVAVLFSHRNPKTLQSSGGENIATNYSDAQSVETGWYNSPGHRANELEVTKSFRENSDGTITYAKDGIGVAYDTGTRSWVTCFANHYDDTCKTENEVPAKNGEETVIVQMSSRVINNGLEDIYDRSFNCKLTIGKNDTTVNPGQYYSRYRNEEKSSYRIQNNLNWSNSNPEVVQVSEDGQTLTALSGGTATLTAHPFAKNETENGTWTVTVTVVDPAICAHKNKRQIVSDEYLISKATCTSSPVYASYCKDCDTILTNDTFKYGYSTNHKYVIHAATSPTCSKAGRERYMTCENCDTIFEYPSCEEVSSINDIKSIKKVGHSYGKYNAALKTGATCTNAAVYYETCKWCGIKGSKTYSSGGALGHSYQYFSARAATCQQKGNKAYYKCTRCNKYFDSKKKSIKSIPTTNKLQHKYIKTKLYLKSGATCTKAAVYYKSCSMCNAKSKNTYSSGSALGHKNELNIVPATITKDGKYFNKCTRCGSKGKATTIRKASKISLASNKVVRSPEGLTEAKVIVKDSKGKTISSAYYTVTFKNEENTGKAIVTLKGRYTGISTLSYQII